MKPGCPGGLSGGAALSKQKRETCGFSLAGLALLLGVLFVVFTRGTRAAILESSDPTAVAH